MSCIVIDTVIDFSLNRVMLILLRASRYISKYQQKMTNSRRISFPRDIISLKRYLVSIDHYDLRINLDDV